MPHEIAVDRDRCMGSGQCLHYAPNTFDLDELGVAVVTDPYGDTEHAIRTAVLGCPARAIDLAEVSADIDPNEGHAVVD